MKREYDIVIAGAGPAGSAAAYFLKRYDNINSKKILLIDPLSKDAFIRYHHMCGEIVSKYIKKDMPQLDFSNFITNEIKKIKEFWGDEVEIKNKLTGYVLDRPKYILHLIDQFKKENGEFLRDRLLAYKQKNENISIKLRNNGNIKTKYLINAIGPNLINKDMSDVDGEIFQSLLYQILVKKYPLEKNCIEFYYDEKYKENYKWISPYKKNIKIGLPFENRNELKNYNKYKIIRKDIRRVYYGILNKYNFGNVLFVGDSAFQNNPLTKGGIRNAIMAGKMAAKSVMEYQDPEKYNDMWKNSRYYNAPYLKTSKKLKKMNNNELIYHSKPLKSFPLSYPLILLKYRKYISLYKTYRSSDKYGW